MLCSTDRTDKTNRSPYLIVADWGTSLSVYLVWMKRVARFFLTRFCGEREHEEWEYPEAHRRSGRKQISRSGCACTPAFGRVVAPYGAAFLARVNAGPSGLGTSTHRAHSPPAPRRVLQHSQPHQPAHPCRDRLLRRPHAGHHRQPEHRDRRQHHRRSDYLRRHHSSDPALPQTPLLEPVMSFDRVHKLNFP